MADIQRSEKIGTALSVQMMDRKVVNSRLMASIISYETEGKVHY